MLVELRNLQDSDIFELLDCTFERIKTSTFIHNYVNCKCTKATKNGIYFKGYNYEFANYTLVRSDV